MPWVRMPWNLVIGYTRWLASNVMPKYSRYLDTRFGSRLFKIKVDEIDHLEREEALRYMKEVQDIYINQPQIYHQFLKLVRNLHNNIGEIDYIMDRITTLFSDQPALIARYNTFLPEGYALICSKNRHSEPRVHVIINTPDLDDSPVRRILPFMTPEAEEAFAEFHTADTMAEIMRTEHGKRTEAALKLLRGIKLWIPASTYKQFVRHMHIDSVPDAREMMLTARRIMPGLRRQPKLKLDFQRFVASYCRICQMTYH